MGERVKVAGHTDLAVGNLKFSGNAQRRKARYYLFHGTILVDFDLELVGRVLRAPSKEPEYRAQRFASRFHPQRAAFARTSQSGFVQCVERT